VDEFHKNKTKMSVKIRLARRGRKKRAMYDVVVADARAPRDGRFIEKLGTYNPNTNPATIVLDENKAFQWVMNGAQPTDTVKAMLSYRGILLKKHLQIGVNKGAITQEQADAKFEEWKNSKDAKITGKVDQLAANKAAREKAKLEAEAKVKEARAEALRQKQLAEQAAAEPVAEVEAEVVAEEAQAPEAGAEATEENPVTE
jgi:small subunit ribosomal protein S16